ncbi:MULTISPECIES: cytochrome d ubiquinol oxidase subunit II [Planococcus]|uniref:Cytochrome D ubiquinol oxidase subunit II n=2 Tax=Planococcus TaxID=1372 RepID=A0ABM5WYH9_9BACL|nr:MULTISPECIES: cytochrome d ubiquinol oxidase subunit II [Planococcus]ALS79390.1 cytochrome D ubiquinol oxidase subunit II [Planococcus kocurii]AQU78640.1 cytochrome D ubiquinol oxidase subunit II [Planococcus faecalis]KAA0955093.1 cytochrome d ubiquinol oxidase subunit II [Planococcus sp. ANT_H30]MDJ0333191.1 cytochrome d ubiquinol oxidase subunit II [Planococcus sp. S3-L1]OHX54469.1 cytochrome D ubiquinol oxidase subunit II [Planococcus faecalis]
MTLEIIGISVLWLFLFLYVIVASIDFGAGFFNAYSSFVGKQHILTGVIQRYLSPVWEVTNVFFVFFFVGIIGFFPQTAFYYGTTLLVPASLALILLAIRGSYYAFATYGAKINHRGYIYMYGLSGLLLPAALSPVLAMSEGGFIQLDNGQPYLDYWALFTSPLMWSIVVLSLTAVLYISSVFLTWYSSKAGDAKATDLMRKYALVWAAPAIVTATGIIYELRGHNPEHYARILDLWWAFALSFLLFAGTVYLIWKKRHYGWAFILLMGQFFTAFFAYGASHYPYLLYPYLTIYDSFTNEAMAIALIIAFIAGLFLLLPSLYLLFRLFLFDKDYVEGKSDYHA